MATTREEANERRVRATEMVDKLLVERQEMLRLFCQVSGLEPYHSEKPVQEALGEFCQVLMDYMAFGHFEIYDRISRNEERRSSVVRVAEEVYPKVVEATDAAVAFNDKYDSSDHEIVLDTLSEDLSILGEKLATRVEMEDRLVAAMKV
jgi:regulator of sigma D